MVPKNRRPFEGDALIDTNREVAIVHDLWNLDKHAHLRSSRSGYYPKVTNLERAMNLSTGAPPGSYTFFTMDPATGQMQVEAPGGTVKLIITGDVVDQKGTRLGDIAEICRAAATAWEAILGRAGVTLPPSAP